MENSIYYKITGTLKSDFGVDIINPVITVGQVATDQMLLSDGNLRFEYLVYQSETNFLANYKGFKAWDNVNNNQRVNFVYPITDVITWSILTYKELQRKIIADVFGFEESDVELVDIV
jgi:hypothetical protein